MYALYTVLLGLAFLLALPLYLWKDRATGKYRASFRERLGRLPPGLDRHGRPAVWVHAVSVGEVLTARPLVRALKQRLPAHAVIVSTTTVTGQALARRTLGEADAVFYAPFDWPGPVRKAIRAARPALLVLVETELWPNLIRGAKRHGARVAIVNGRISPRSFGRYRLVKPALRRVLSEMDLFLMQAEAHADRIRTLGAPGPRVRVTGNLKFDALDPSPPDGALVRLLLDGQPERCLWVAGSTVPGEEEHVLAALREVRARVPQLRVVLAPRHPERSGDVSALVDKAGFVVDRRTALQDPWTGDVLVLDTLGELAQVYALATVVFVGGSLEPHGGHNVLEPAVAGKAVIVGPHMQNFQEIAEEFRREGALVQIGAPAELGSAVADLLADPERRLAIGARARGLVARNRGALERTVDALAALTAPV